VSKYLSGKADGRQELHARAKRILYDHAVLSAKVGYPNSAAAKLMTIVRGSNAFRSSVWWKYSQTPAPMQHSKTSTANSLQMSIMSMPNTAQIPKLSMSSCPSR
jgi:hypothetical protein